MLSFAHPDYKSTASLCRPHGGLKDLGDVLVDNVHCSLLNSHCSVLTYQANHFLVESYPEVMTSPWWSNSDDCLAAHVPEEWFPGLATLSLSQELC